MTCCAFFYYCFALSFLKVEGPTVNVSGRHYIVIYFDKKPFIYLVFYFIILYIFNWHLFKIDILTY